MHKSPLLTSRGDRLWQGQDPVEAPKRDSQPSVGGEQVREGFLEEVTGELNDELESVT